MEGRPRGEFIRSVELGVLLKTNYILKGEHALGPSFNPQLLKGRENFSYSNNRITKFLQVSNQ